MRACVLVLVLLACRTAAAQDASDPMANGLAARAAGDHAAALSRFATAWERDASATARAEMGLEELALDRFVLAEAHLTEALALGTDLEARRAELEAALRTAAAHLGSLDVHCPASCEVHVDGERIGVTPLGRLVRVASGAHAVRGALFDHTDADVVVEVIVGAAVRVDLAPVAIDHRPILERAGREGLRTIGAVSLSLGLASLVTGGVLAGLAVDSASSGRRSDESTFKDFALGTLVAGAVLTAVGIVFLVIEPVDDTRHVACAPILEGGLVCAGTF